MGTVEAYYTGDQLMGRKNHQHYGPQPSLDGSRPKGPPEVKLDKYTRAEDIKDEEAIAAFQLVSTVNNVKFCDRAFDVLYAWLENKYGDMNLEAGLNWDGSKIKGQEPPECPAPSKCRLNYRHWGDCNPNSTWTPPDETPRQDVTADTAHGPTPYRKAIILRPGEILVNGTMHKDCKCEVCDAINAAGVRGAQAPAPGEIHPEASISDEEKIDMTTANETGLFTSFYEMQGKGQCTHTWIARLVDRVFCEECGKRPSSYVVNKIQFPGLDARVMAYKEAQAKARRTKEMSSE